MARVINIKVAGRNISAELNNSKTAGMIYEALPIEGTVRLWGEEIYFEIPVMADLEQDFAKDTVEIGDLGYWPQGPAFCVFFGQTPISTAGNIRPASAVNIVGRIKNNLEELKKVKESDKITIEELK